MLTYHSEEIYCIRLYLDLETKISLFIIIILMKKCLKGNSVWSIDTIMEIYIHVFRWYCSYLVKNNYQNEKILYASEYQY